ncbi:MAG: hypothetical protein MK135_13175 [Polyangiaceae bacterium]|nr:hypothetical protein [Polyangiaceae bacterium]
MSDTENPRSRYKTAPGGGQNRVSSGRPSASAYVSPKTLPPVNEPQLRGDERRSLESDATQQESSPEPTVVASAVGSVLGADLNRELTPASDRFIRKARGVEVSDSMQMEAQKVKTLPSVHATPSALPPVGASRAVASRAGSSAISSALSWVFLGIAVGWGAHWLWLLFAAEPISNPQPGPAQGVPPLSTPAAPSAQEGVTPSMQQERAKLTESAPSPSESALPEKGTSKMTAPERRANLASPPAAELPPAEAPAQASAPNAPESSNSGELRPKLRKTSPKAGAEKKPAPAAQKSASPELWLE